MLMQQRVHDELAESSTGYSLSALRAPAYHVSDEVWGKIVATLRRHGIELLPDTTNTGAGVRGGSCRALSDRGFDKSGTCVHLSKRQPQEKRAPDLIRGR
jgi:hypothetical protein